MMRFPLKVGLALVSGMVIGASVFSSQTVTGRETAWQASTKDETTPEVIKALDRKVQDLASQVDSLQLEVAHFRRQASTGGVAAKAAAEDESLRATLNELVRRELQTMRDGIQATDVTLFELKDQFEHHRHQVRGFSVVDLQTLTSRSGKENLLIPFVTTDTGISTGLPIR